MIYRYLVVGSTGKNIPTMPRASDRVPIAINSAFVTGLIFHLT